MKIKTSELKEILLKIKPGLATKGIVEQATHFIFTGVDVLTYNDQISISYPLETDFECSVPAEILYNIIKDLKGEEVSLELKDNQLLLSSGRTKAGINISTDDSIIKMVADMGVPKDSDWKPLSEEFLEGLELCIFSASKDISRPYMTCISVEEDRLVSGDDLRISLFALNKKVPNRFLLPATSAIELIKFNVVEYSLGSAWIHFCTEDEIIFCSRIVAEEYPNVSKFFDMNGPSLKLPAEFKNSISIVAPIADGDFDIDKQIEVAIEGNKIRCRAEGVGGWAETSLDLETKIPDLGFKVNPIFLSEILDKETVMTYEEGKILFVSGKLKHLVALYG